MPPGQQLGEPDIAILRRWIEGGAVLPESAPVATASGDAKAQMAKLEDRPITSEERSFWAFRRPVRTDPPSGYANPVDAFLQAALKSKGLTVSQSGCPHAGSKSVSGFDRTSADTGGDRRLRS